MNKKKLLGTPYFIWSAIFIIIPLCMVFYYGFTDKSGAFTLENIIAISSPEHAKALYLALGLSLISTLICLLLAYPLAMILCGLNVNQLYRADLHPSHVDEFFAPHPCMADSARKNRRHKQPSFVSSSACPYNHQHPLRHYTRHGLQLFALYGAAYIQRSGKNRPQCDKRC